MQTRAVLWRRETAGTRPHGTTHRVPRVLSETEGRVTLLPAPTVPFHRELRSWVGPDLVIIDDFGLRKLTAQQSSDL
jgi:hypothetical protein